MEHTDDASAKSGGKDHPRRDFKLFRLDTTSTGLLFIYYLTLMIAGLCKSVKLVGKFSFSHNVDTKAIQLAIAMAIVGSSVFYSRKLYQACINGTYGFAKVPFEEDKPEQIFQYFGTLAYFLLRPIFGAAFAVFVYAVWRLSVSASDSGDLKPSSGFLYITLSLGFISGFLAGRLLPLIEGYGVSRLGSVISKDAEYH